MREILFRLLSDEHNRVALDHKIVAIRVMMSGGKGDGIDLML